MPVSIMQNPNLAIKLKQTCQLTNGYYELWILLKRFAIGLVQDALPQNGWCNSDTTPHVLGPLMSLGTSSLAHTQILSCLKNSFKPRRSNVVTIDQHHDRGLREAAVWAVCTAGTETWRSRSEALGSTERCNRDESQHHFGPGQILSGHRVP